MITPYVVFWIMWLFWLLGGLWVYPPYQEPNYRPFGLHMWVWIMLGLLGLMAGGSPFKGW